MLVKLCCDRIMSYTVTFQRWESIMHFKLLLKCTMLVSLFSTSLHAQEKPAEIKQARPSADFLILPLKIYRLKSADVPSVDCRQLTDADLKRVVAKVNTVWAAAGIYWLLDSIEDVAAENTGRIKLAGIADEKIDEKPNVPARKPHLIFRESIPKATRNGFEGYRVYYIHDFDVNGVYFGRREAMVKETAALRPVEDGIDEPLPRVTSHELGHGLGLPHRQDRLNLMASGTTGTLLNEKEIATTRETALKNPAVVKFSDLQKQLAAETDSAGKEKLAEALKFMESVAGKPIHPLAPAAKTLGIETKKAGNAPK